MSTQNKYIIYSSTIRFLDRAYLKLYNSYIFYIFNALEQFGTHPTWTNSSNESLEGKLEGKIYLAV